MANGRLTIWIDGLEALPVRAIPYVAGWEHRYSPDVVAESLARTTAAPFGKLRNLVAYHRPEGKPQPVMAGEWNAVVAEVKGYEAELHEQRPDMDSMADHVGYAAWRKGAALKLPAGVFVWLDEFLREREADRKRLLGDDMPVTLMPMLDDDTRAAVLEGFEDCRRQENEEREEAYFHLGFHSIAARKFGSPDWAYWLSLPFWTARDAACLLVELNPDRYDMVATAINPQPRKLAEHIATVERKAIREQQVGKLCEKPSPQQWAAWALRSGYALPVRLQSVYAQTGELPPDLTSADEAEKVGAGVAAVSILPPGVPTGTIVQKFRLSDAWKSKLTHIKSNPFLKDALMHQGCRKKSKMPATPHLWNPVRFAEILIARDGRNLRAMEAIITNHFAVWQDVWHESMQKENDEADEFAA